MKAKLIKPRVKKVKYAQEESEYASMGGTMGGGETNLTVANFDEAEIGENSEFLDKALAEAIAKVKNAPPGTTVNIEIEEEEQEESEWAEDESKEEPVESVKESLKEFLKEAVKEAVEQAEDYFNRKEEESQGMEEQEQQEEQSEESQEEPQNEEEEKEEQEEKKDKNTCSDKERAFLDSFYQLQEAGMLLKMVPTGSLIEGKIVNLELMPRVNTITQTDVLKNQEEMAQEEVYNLFGPKLAECAINLVELMREKNLIKQG